LSALGQWFKKLARGRWAQVEAMIEGMRSQPTEESK